MSLLMDALKQQQQVPVAAVKAASGHGWRIAALTLLVVLGLLLGFFIGQYQFNKPRQVLHFQQEERKLSYRESELLLYLFEHRNHIIERRDLLNAIWGNDSIFNSRNLDVYITKIRSYLKEDPSLEILTIKGVGYKFEL